MPVIPALLLKRLYVKGSLKATDSGFGLSIKNTLAPGTITGLSPVVVDDTVVPLDRISIGRRGTSRPASKITPAAPFSFNLNEDADIWIDGVSLEPGRHTLTVTITTKEVGELRIQVEDVL